MQILLRLPEMPQPQEHSQRATNLQFFVLLHKVVPEERLLRKPEVGVCCSLDGSHLSGTQGGKHFSGCYPGTEGAWGDQDQV